MSQWILDQNDKVTQGSRVPAGELPRSLRDTGRCLDLNDLSPGDLILVSRATPTYWSKRIEAAQLGAYAPEDARWTHAAIYVGEAMVCEATFKGRGVHIGELYKYAGSDLLRARRDLKMTERQRCEVAVNALTRIGGDYDIGVIRYLYRRLAAGLQVVHDKRPRRDTYICSQLYADSYTFVTGRVLDRRRPIVTPAALSATTELEDVPVRWRAIGSGPG